MKINRGLFNRMVLQRTKAGKSDAEFSGISNINGIVLATVALKGRTLKGWSRKKIGNAAKGKLKGRICGLPSGGPYDIRISIDDSSGKTECMEVKDVLVGDVWILAGQSNMEGMGYLKDALKPVPHVRAFYMDDNWDTAKDPIHNLSKSVDQVHADLAGGQPPKRQKHVGVGPGVSFGQEMYRRTGIPQGLISCAHGGTPMLKWAPELKNPGSHSLYGAMLRRFHKNGGRVAGVLWYQGCSDTSSERVKCYRDGMHKLIRSMRRDFRDPNLPIVAVQIAGVANPSHNRFFWNRIREEQRLLQENIPNCAVVPAIDLELDDHIHLSGKSQNRLGRRIAQAMCVLRKEKSAGKPPITLESICYRKNSLSGNLDIIASFGNVIGELKSSGKPSGFTVGNPNPVNKIYRTDLKGSKVFIRVKDDAAGNYYLYYGYGLMPFCNITDSADRSIPAFGPQPVGELRALSDFVKNLRVSRTMPGAGKLEGLSFPKNIKELEFKAREFKTDFCDIHSDVLNCAPNDASAYYACDIECSEAMKLRLCIGYDGPVKVWVDGKEIYHDPKASNPAIIDRGVADFNVASGRHQVLIALGSNFGRAYGIFLRFMRRDLSQKVIGLGPESYEMPKILG